MRLLVSCDTPQWRRRWWQLRRPHRWERRGLDAAGNRVLRCRTCHVAGIYGGPR